MTMRAVMSPRKLQVGLALQRHGALMALVLLVVFGAIRYGERFAVGYNVQSLLGDDAKYAFVALGMTYVIMAGGIDLSVGSVVMLGGVVAAKVSAHGLLAGVAAGVGVGAAAGLLNGTLISRLKLQPFIVTLATLLALRGLALDIADTKAAVASATSDFQRLGDWEALGLPVAAWAMFVAFVIGAAALRYTPFGRQVLA